MGEKRENEPQGGSFSFSETKTSSSAQNIFVEFTMANFSGTENGQTFTAGSDFEVLFDPRKACVKCGKPVPPYGVYDATTGKGYCSPSCFEGR